MKIDKDLTTIVNKIVNIRDKYKPCIICGYPIGNNPSNVCHFIKKSQSTILKYMLSNVNKGHQYCNQLEENDSNLSDNHSINVLDRIGIEEFMKLTNMKRQTIKFGASDKKELLSILKLELKYYECLV